MLKLVVVAGIGSLRLVWKDVIARGEQEPSIDLFACLFC